MEKNDLRLALQRVDPLSHNNFDDLLDELYQELQAARAQGAEPVGFIQAYDMDMLRKGQPARIFAPNNCPSPFESHQFVYTQPQSAGVPETATEEMLDEGVTALIRGFRAFPGNYTQVVSNIWEDMRAAATTPQPEGDGWITCSQKDPTDADGYKVWFSPDGVRSYLLAPSVLSKSTRKQGYWKPTGLKRPQPPKEQ